MSNYTLITAATVEPVTLAEAKTQLRELSDDHDPLITSLICAARDYVERQTGLQLLQATWKLTLPDFPRKKGGVIELRKPPVKSVSEIAYVDTAGDAQTVNASNYLLDISGKTGCLYPVENYFWPVTRHPFGAVEITFVSGESTADDLPEIVRQLVLMLVEQWFDQPQMVGQPTIGITPLLDSLRWAVGGSYV